MKCKAYIKEVIINREHWGSSAELRVIVNSESENIFNLVQGQREVYIVTEEEEQLIQEKNGKILLEIFHEMRLGTRIDQGGKRL